MYSVCGSLGGSSKHSTPEKNYRHCASRETYVAYECAEKVPCVHSPLQVTRAFSCKGRLKNQYNDN